MYITTYSIGSCVGGLQRANPTPADLFLVFGNPFPSYLLPPTYNFFFYSLLCILTYETFYVHTRMCEYNLDIHTQC